MTGKGRDSQNHDLARRLQFMGARLNGRYSALDRESAWYAKFRLACIPMPKDDPIHVIIAVSCQQSVCPAKIMTWHPACIFRVLG
jgi:hypothetical protein